MTNDIHNALVREIWKHNLFPALLLLMEELPSWESRATALNNAGFSTYYNKRWTKQNLHKVYYSYWNDNGGMYSWRKHGEQINAVRKSVSPVNTCEAMAA